MKGYTKNTEIRDVALCLVNLGLIMAFVVFVDVAFNSLNPVAAWLITLDLASLTCLTFMSIIFYSIEYQ